MLPYTLALAPHLLALSALAAAGPLITGTQVSAGYSNLASVALLWTTEFIGARAAVREDVPAEPAPQPVVPA